MIRDRGEISRFRADRRKFREQHRYDKDEKRASGGVLAGAEPGATKGFIMKRGAATANP